MSREYNTGTKCHGVKFRGTNCRDTENTDPKGDILINDVISTVCWHKHGKVRVGSLYADTFPMYVLGILEH